MNALPGQRRPRAARIALCAVRAACYTFIMSRESPRAIVLIAAVLALLCTGGRVAYGACADAPSAGVNWQRCLMDKRTFVEIDLRGAKLQGASFGSADLSGSDLTGADATKASFIRTKLIGTSFDDAGLMDTDFTRADLTGASLRNADLRLARFYRAILRDVDLTGARVKGADLLNADLTGAIWIDGEKRCGEGSIGLCN
ncbi:MAG: pentapeptide repeat-containing protein [Proteobacteria bacterium]|nr:pentapeptide repeat-containing protein [Pseudomonadota bacterium]